MQQLTQLYPTPTKTLALAVAALTRLGDLAVTLGNELKSLPRPHTNAVDADVLIRQINEFWQASGAQGKGRRRMFIDAMEQGLRDELVLKIHERNLDEQYSSCVPAPAGGEETVLSLDTFSLHVQLSETRLCEVAGALVFINAQGHALLVLPGVGAQGFASRTLLGDALVGWLNNDVLRHALLSNVELKEQQLIEAISNDPQLDLEPFTVADLQLKTVAGNAFEYALDRQLEKQRNDVRQACADTTDSTRLEAAIAMQGLFGPGAMLAQREIGYWEHQQRRNLPHWVKIASQSDLDQYQHYLTRYEQGRTALLSALGGAASHEHFARMKLRARLASDLGYDLEPEQVMLTIQRRLGITGELYTINRSLLQLALYGLHPGDLEADSAFQTLTTLRLNDALMTASHPLLTTAYIARLVDELQLGTMFREYQRTVYAAEHTQQLMRDLTRKQITALAFAAKLQGHIQPQDLAFIEQIESDPTGQTTPHLQVQQIKLDDGEVLGGVLVFRKNDAQGQLERLVMFASGAPGAQCFHSFDTPTQLLNELVRWAASPQMSQYLLEQVSVSSRENLEKRFAALRLKPYPPANYVQLITRSHFQQALGQFVRQHVRVAAANQAQRMPDWYLRASPAQRQELLALEDAIVGATENFHAKPPTQAQDFDAYVHERASKKISELLGVAHGSVDPDQIIITSEREVLSYTQMLRNGYDDSLGWLTSSADTQATFSGPDGVNLAPLTAQKVARSVHGKWLSDDYIKHVRETLLDAKSPGYTHRRKSSLQITVLQMKAAALRSLLKGQVDARQYQWLKLSLDNLHRTDSTTRRRYPLHTLQLRLDNALIATDLAKAGEVANDIYNIVSPIKVELTQVETVQGCYLLSSADAKQAAILYTPQAPDGLELRLLSEFKTSLSSPGMIDYYKDRCRVDARRKLSFFLRDMEQGGRSKPPVIPRDAVSDFQDICFNRPLERQLRDVEDTTNGRADMLARLAWVTFELVATIATLPFPPASFAVGAMLSLHDSVMALKAFANGDRETASSYILSSLFNSLGAAGDLSAGMKGFGALRLLGHGGQNPSTLSAIKNVARTPSQAQLLPVNLEGEVFWRSKPNANGHASVFRSTPHPSASPQATGQFARREPNGAWLPLNQASGQPVALPTDGVKPGFAVNVSLHNATPLATSHGKGVSLLNGKYYIELHGKVFEVQFDAATRQWNVIDPHNPFAFFGKRPVHLDDQGKWQLSERAGLRGGMETSFKPLQAEHADPVTAAVVPYELPRQSRAHFDLLAETGNWVDNTGMGLEEYFAGVFRELRSNFTTQREKLYRDAELFFTSVIPKPKPALPLLDVNTDPSGLIKKVFESSNGMVISEVPKSIASKRLLIENMSVLAEHNVEVLYIQHLFTDLHMYKLEKYRRLGARSKAGSTDIRVWLATLNGGQLKNASKEFDYYHVIKAAHRHGIEVRPFSSAVSYPLVNNPVLSAAEDIVAEQKTSNFFGNIMIGADAAAHPTRRWVALLDQKLANTYEQVAGIAELQGAISVRVHDAPATSPTRITRDFDVPNSGFSKADFKIEIGNPLMRDQSASGLTPANVPSVPTLLDEALHRQIHGIASTEIDNSFVGKPGFVWKETGGWQAIDAQNWPAESPPTALQLSLTDTFYGMPAVTRSSMHDLINFKRKGLDSRFFLDNDEHSLVRDSFFAQRRKLQKDARKIIAAELPNRPTVPSVSPGISHGDLLEDLYQHTHGVVIGESHSSIASKKLIIDNLPQLARQDVKTLYMEHLLSDVHQADLDRFVETGQMSKSLLHDLKKLDLGHHTDPDGVYTFEQVVIKAQANGLDIRAIDCAASYHIKEIDHPSLTTRQQMFSYFASRTLRKHQEVMGAHKWIALVGNSHANTYQKIIPGLAELEGGIGIRVLDVRPGQSRGVVIDPGELLPIGLTDRYSTLKSDLRLEMETLKPIVAIRPAKSLPVEERLARPGMFLVEDGDDGIPVIVHRSRDNTIHRTPVRVSAQGQVYVDRATWPTVSLRTFADMDALIVGLEEINLTRVA